jgi:hypothetical protein
LRGAGSFQRGVEDYRRLTRRTMRDDEDTPDDKDDGGKHGK